MDNSRRPFCLFHFMGKDKQVTYYLLRRFYYQIPIKKDKMMNSTTTLNSITYFISIWACVPIITQKRPSIYKKVWAVVYGTHVGMALTFIQKYGHPCGKTTNHICMPQSCNRSIEQIRTMCYKNSVWYAYPCNYGNSNFGLYANQTADLVDPKLNVGFIGLFPQIGDTKSMWWSKNSTQLRVTMKIKVLILNLMATPIIVLKW